MCHAGPRRFGRLAFLEVDEDVLAVLLERVELLLGAQHEPLEHERRLRPGAVELGHEHAELQLIDGELLFFHCGRYFSGNESSTSAAR